MKKANNKIILKILKEAKKEFLEYKSFASSYPSKGMCYHIGRQFTLLEVYRHSSLSDDIPEFTSKFLGGGLNSYWWDTHDYKSREKAFDKLIAIYSKKVKEGSLSYKITKFIKEKYEKMFKVCKAS